MENNNYYGSNHCGITRKYISISILRDYWLVTMRGGHKRFLVYLDFSPEAWGGLFLPFVFMVKRLVFVLNLKNSLVYILNSYRRTMKINNDA